jgi:SAM-dependent methyltransferase
MSIQEDLRKTYSRRFEQSLSYRNQVWRVLVSDFFSKYISRSSVVLDLGCGYGQFINNVSCSRKYAMDLNPEARQHVSRDVEFLQQDCSEPWPLSASSLDVVFTSNFFEHLPSKNHLARTIEQIYRCLRPNGRIISMGPNVKAMPGAYWDFFDHHIALTELSMQEAFEVGGLSTEIVIDKFLPYTMVGAPEYPLMFIQLYLKFPLIWRFFGGQFLVIARC